jgi:hypothetical protein
MGAVTLEALGVARVKSVVDNLTSFNSTLEWRVEGQGKISDMRDQ